MEGPQTVHPFTNPVSEDSGFELNLHRLSCDKSCPEDEQCICTYMTENVVKKVQQASYCFPAIEKGHATDGEVGVDEILNRKSFQEQLPGHDPTSEEDKVYNSEDIGVCKELIISDVRQQKCLIKSATFPSSEAESLNFSYPEINGASPNTAASDQRSSADQILIYKRSTSLPASSKLVSAMKGGRTQNGTSPRIDMRVKWAEDVYDPPATSLSHTVRSYSQQRPKARRKENHKQKHSKGKNSRGSSNGNKFPSRAKLQSGRANGSTAQPEDCGSSFLRESLAKVHPDQEEKVALRIVQQIIVQMMSIAPAERRPTPAAIAATSDSTNTCYFHH